jgi:flagellin
MGLQIATNVAAINAQRNLANTGVKMGKVLEKLSSGYRINRAADDAAGLAISEKMRSQIRGSQQAVRNAQDGISMVQTAEGALDEVHSVLQRMRELAVQAANGTYADGSPERTSLGQEINQLKQEIDRIGLATKFNGQNLLTGTLTGALGGATATDLIIGDQLTTTAVAAVTAVNVSGARAQTYTFSSAGAGILTLTGADGSAQTLSGITDLGANETRTLNFANLGVSVTIQANSSGKAIADIVTDLTAAADDTIVVSGSGASSFQIGANAGDSLSISFTSLQTSALGTGPGNMLSDLVTDNLNVDTQAKASTLLSVLDGAIGVVNSQRGTLGASQNRLESVIKSLSVTVENLSSAESRIRDADIAELSSQMVSQQILQQAGISVLAQANQAPQTVLALLRQ